MTEVFDLKKFIEERRFWYKSIKSLYCPVLGVKIIFNQRGFGHLLYNSFERPRKKHVQRERLELLSYVPLIIKRAKNIARTKEDYITVTGKLVHYWTFERKIKGTHIEVVVRKVGSGAIHFYSVGKFKR